MQVSASCQNNVIYLQLSINLLPLLSRRRAVVYVDVTSTVEAVKMSHLSARGRHMLVVELTDRCAACVCQRTVTCFAGALLSGFAAYWTTRPASL